nr:MAG TPA: hypothetical protein [Microviridae sp.]
MASSTTTATATCHNTETQNVTCVTSERFKNYSSRKASSILTI